MICLWIENKIEECPDFLNDIWFSDKIYFWLCGHVNSNNCVYWNAESPEEVFQRPLHSAKCMAWVPSQNKIIRQFWFENAGEELITVLNVCYIDVMNKFYRTLETYLGVKRRCAIVQTTPYNSQHQDGRARPSIPQSADQ